MCWNKIVCLVSLGMAKKAMAVVVFDHNDENWKSLHHHLRDPWNATPLSRPDTKFCGISSIEVFIKLVVKSTSKIELEFVISASKQLYYM